MPQQLSVIDSLNKILDDIHAMDKRAGDSTHHIKGKGGKSQHPTASVEDHLRPANDGAQAKSNEREVRETVPNNAAQAAGPDSAKGVGAPQIGTKKSPTGGDPAVENNYKERKYDPGTSLPADVEEMGEKYSFAQLRKMAADLHNDITSQLLATVDPTPEVKAAAAQGYQAAAQVIDMEPLDNSTVESLKISHGVDVVATVKQAGFRLADLVGQYLQKQAEGEETPPPMPEEAGAEAGPAEGELPPEAAAAMAGAAEPGMDGGAGAEGDGGELDLIMQALQEAGITPEQLLQMLQGAEQGSDAPAEAAAGAPPEKIVEAATKRASLDKLIPPAYRYPLMNQMQEVSAHVKSGKARIKAAQPGSPADVHKNKYREYVSYVIEALRA